MKFIKKIIILALVFAFCVATVSMQACFNNEEKEYTVTFNSNGGSVVSSQTVKENGHVSKPDDPSKEGQGENLYQFEYWYLENEEPFNFELYTVKEDITLYAKWDTQQKTYKITFTSNESSAVFPFSELYLSYGESYDLTNYKPTFTDKKNEPEFDYWKVQGTNTKVDNVGTWGYKTEIVLVCVAKETMPGPYPFDPSF